MNKLLIAFTLLFLTITKSMIASANCIESEMLKQIENIQVYFPKKIWNVLKDTPIPEKLKNLSSDSTELNKFKTGIKPYTEEIKKKLASETSQREYLAMVDKKLNGFPQKNIGIWEIVIMQSTARCIKNGKL